MSTVNQHGQGPIMRFLQRVRERIFGPVTEGEGVTKEITMDIDKPFNTAIDKSGLINVEISTSDDFKIAKQGDCFYIFVRDGSLRLSIDNTEIGSLHEDNVEIYITPIKGVDIKVNTGVITVSTFGKIKESRRVVKFFVKEGETDLSKVNKAKIYVLSIKTEEVVKKETPEETSKSSTSSGSGGEVSSGLPIPKVSEVKVGVEKEEPGKSTG